MRIRCPVCSGMRRSERVMCPRCWRELSQALKHDIYEHEHDPGSAAYRAAAALAVNEAITLRAARRHRQRQRRTG